MAYVLRSYALNNFSKVQFYINRFDSWVFFPLDNVDLSEGERSHTDNSSLQWHQILTKDP